MDIVGAIIQARMGSTRLPGKTLIDISGKPLLGHVLERVRAARKIQTVIVATTEAAEDDCIQSYAEQQGVSVFRGDRDDVLDRFYRAAERFGTGVIVRVTADDPFKDPALLDEAVSYFLAHAADFDYVSNWIQPTYPEGMEVEIFTMEALRRAWKEAKLKTEREHVTPYLWMHPELFRLSNIASPEDLSSLRLTLDTAEDLQFTRSVYCELYKGKPFGMGEVLGLLKRKPELATINHGRTRYESFWKAYRKETACGVDA